MKKIAYYVLYSEQQISQFRDKFSFIPVLAINPSQIDSIDASFFLTKRKHLKNSIVRLPMKKSLTHSLILNAGEKSQKITN